jgi:hypothetical protein
MSDLSFPEIVEQPLADSTPAPVASELVDKAEVTNGTVLVAYNRTEAALADLKQRYTGATFDLTTTKGDKAARQARVELITLRTSLEKKRLELKRPALTFGKKIDEEAARIQEQILALERPIDAQIKADEERREKERQERERIEAERKAKHEAGIATIRGYLQKAQGLPSERISNGVTLLEGMAFGAEWEEFAEQATTARDETLAALRKLHADTLAAERRAVEEARIRKEHAEQQQALQIGQLALGLMGKPAADIRQQLNLLELTVYPEGTAAVVQQAHDSAVATLKTMLELAEERETRQAQHAEAMRKADAALDAAIAAELRKEQDPPEGVQPGSEPGSEGMAPEACESATGRGMDGAPALVTHPHHESPGVGPMGAGQPADAGPTGEMVPGTAEVAATPAALMANVEEALLRDALQLVEYLRSPFAGRFPSHPKPDSFWWAGLRTQLDKLEPRLQAACGVEVSA